MEGIGYGILAVVALFAVSYLYLKVKEKAKKKIFFKEQYEMQKNLTGNLYVFDTAAPIETIKEALSKRIQTDDSFSANFFGGNYRITAQAADSITYLHGAKITTGGGGDEFSAKVFFMQIENGLKVIAEIIQWRVKDGVTRKAGIQAMQNFFNSVSLAVKDADPNATLKIIQKRG